ncbi:MAG: MFS transporter [Planctomycetes bacterium]|nr:MFS transporter [Planctomycetota bacterium]
MTLSAPGRVLLFCWLGWVLEFYELVLFAFVKPALGLDLALDTAQLAWIDGLTFAAAALGGVLLGRHADRHGRRRALCASIACFSAGALLTGLAQGFASLALARVVLGLGLGGEWGVGHAAVAEAHPVARRNRAAAALQTASPIGLGLAAALGCFVAPGVGWRAVFLASSLGAALILLARWSMPDDRAPAGSPRLPLALLLDPRHRASTLRIGVLLVLHMTGFWCCYAWLPSLLLREGGASPAFVGGFHVALAAAHALADLVFGRLADRFGRTRVFVALGVLSAAGLLLVALGFERLRHDAVLVGLALAAIGLGAGTWSAFGVWFAEAYGPELRATAASLLYNLARVSQLVAQPLLALAFAATGTLAVALWVGVACALGSALVAARAPSTASSVDAVAVGAEARPRRVGRRDSER